MYHGLDRLVLRDVQLASVTTSALVTSFPNITTLSLLAHWDDADDPSWSIIRSNNRKGCSTTSWSHLHRVRGTALDIFALGIPHPVTCLSIVDLTTPSIPLFHEVLRSLRPVNLSLDIRLQYFSDIQLASAIPVDLSRAMQLRYLTLSLDMSSGPFMAQPRKLMVHLIASDYTPTAHVLYPRTLCLRFYTGSL